MNDVMAKVGSRKSGFVLGALAIFALGWGAVSAQTTFLTTAVGARDLPDAGQAREALERAQATAEFAQERAERFSAEAVAATAEVDRLANESAALAARIQQSEADIAAASAELALIGEQRQQLDARLAERQQPLVQLTAALQNMARRPLVLSALQPGSVRDTVYVRAVLETTLPEIRAKTADLRGEVERGRQLELDARRTLADLQQGETALQSRRDELAALTLRQQQLSRSNSAMARREAQRALALAEDARNLDDLVSEFDRASSVKAELSVLAGPIVRPQRPTASRVVPVGGPAASAPETAAPEDYQLPVQGRPLVGFGEEDQAGLRSKGLTVVPAKGAQIVAPAAGRVVFAGEYRGFGRIVIIEHPNGWTSLITGIAQTSITTGAEVIAGAPIGTAGQDQPEIAFELRNQGSPVNPLNFL